MELSTQAAAHYVIAPGTDHVRIMMLRDLGYTVVRVFRDHFDGVDGFVMVKRG